MNPSQPLSRDVVSVDVELGQGNGGMSLEQSDDHQQQNQVAQQPQVKAVKQPKMTMAQPQSQSQLNKMTAKESNHREDNNLGMHATQFRENDIQETFEIAPKPNEWFTKKVLVCIIIILLLLIGVGGGSFWYFYPRESKKNDVESPTKETKSGVNGVSDDVPVEPTGRPNDVILGDVSGIRDTVLQRPFPRNPPRNPVPGDPKWGHLVPQLDAKGFGKEDHEKKLSALTEAKGDVTKAETNLKTGGTAGK